MGSIAELRRRTRGLAGPFLGAVVVVYFAYHTVQGDRGLIAWMRMKSEVVQAEQALTALKDQEQALEHRVRLLRSDSLDPDMLDEQARRMLNMVRPDEMVVILPEDDR